ncbi:hypothetical protein ACTJIJ_11165 [Niabella sp. 22666]|uniref:hypothetical protein n=1 Tax=Niabella sp. 22666 TaxID=3453954 RepID=UPI003F84D49A
MSLSGDIQQFEITAGHPDLHLIINPVTLKTKSATPYQLPLFKSLATIKSLDIIVERLGQAFDCKSLLQFPQVTSLNLTGNMTNTYCLKELMHLERLGIRYAPNLEDFPALSTWCRLKSFIGWNIEELTGKRLNAELKVLSKQKELDYSSVSKLRSSIWFTTEYGIPFTNWEGEKSATAIKAYKSALKAINKAKTEAEVYDAIAGLVKFINTLANIETTEREDTGVAVGQLIEASSLNISREKANKWFDDWRGF